jgi:homoserine kinase
MQTVIWQIPATSANLGPGFDALGLALSLYNRTALEGTADREIRVIVRGLGERFIPTDARNLTLRAFHRVFGRAHEPLPKGLCLTEENHIPPSSGLGSSAAAVLAGLLLANDWLGKRFDDETLLQIGAEIEGHADNIAAAMWGGLVVNAGGLMRRFDLPAWTAVVVTPALYWPTRQARKVLPRRVLRTAAAANIGRSILVTEALRTGDLDLLRQTMHDQLHEPYRLPHIPGAARALKAARSLGAAAALSGAGPSLIAFVEPSQAEEVAAVMQAEFSAAHMQSESRILQVTNRGAWREP